MTSTLALRLRPLTLFAGLFLMVLLVEWLIIQRPDFSLRPALPAAVTFDLLVGVPALFYFLIVRRYRLPASAVAGVFGAMLAVGYYLIPVGQQLYLGWARHILVLLEGAAAVAMALNFRRLIRAYAQAARHCADFVENLHTTFTTVFGRSWAPLVSELVMLRYALLSWRARPEVQAGQRAFSISRQSGFPALIIALIGVSTVETAVAHLLLSRWSAAAALVALLLSAYTLVFLLAHLRAVPLRPIVLDNAWLSVRVGFIWRLKVRLEAIAKVEELRDVPIAAKHQLNLAKPILASPNVLITFAQPIPVIGLYGLRRMVSQVAVHVDERTLFVEQLRAAAQAS